MDAITVLGFAAGGFGICAALPQIIRTWKLKETKDISLWMYIISFTATILWLAYGLLVKDLPLTVANIIAMIFVSVMIFFKLKYG